MLAYGFDGAKLTLLTGRRFANRTREADGHLRWDFEGLWSSVQAGLAEVGAEVGRVDSIGVDAWGVDYGLLDAGGALVDQPFCYRDARTSGLVDAAAGVVGRERMYDETGIQLMEINTLYQLYADVRAGGDRFRRARRLLLIPDLMHHRLSGASVSETTIATTTACYDVRRRSWATGLLDDLGIPTGILPEVVEPGTDLGPVLPDVLPGEAFRHARVVLPGSHDTASAVAGVPFAQEDAAFISSGTWSLVGVETGAPVVTAATRQANLTNEGGVFGTNRLLRNVMGLWLLQECRRTWEREGIDLGYAELVALAESSLHGSVIDVDHPEFLAPGDMPARIGEYCRREGIPEPRTVGEFVRCILVSLAHRYARIVDRLAEVTNRPVSTIHVVGGGSNNHLLDRLTANATGREVHAGPTEATGLGNALVQLISLGELSGLEEARQVVRQSEHVRTFAPTDT